MTNQPFQDGWRWMVFSDVPLERPVLVGSYSKLTGRVYNIETAMLFEMPSPKDQPPGYVWYSETTQYSLHDLPDVWKEINK